MDTPHLDINEPGDRRETQRAIIDSGRSLLLADWGAMVTLNPITRQFYGPCVVTSELRERDANKVQSWLGEMGLLAIKNELDYLTEFPKPPDVFVDGFGLANTGSIRVITLRTRRERAPMAVLFLGFRSGVPLDADGERDPSALVLQACSVLENIWTLGRYRAVIKIGQTLNRKLSGYRDLFGKLREEVAGIIDTSYFFMLAVHKPQSNLIDRYFSFERGNTVVQLDMKVDGACKAVIKSGHSLKSFHLSHDKSWKVEHVDLFPNAKPQTESVIFEPLIFRGEVLGVLTVQKLERNGYDEEDIRIMKLLSNQVALALSNLRLFNYLETLNEVGQRLTKDLTSEDLLKDVAEEVRKATHADIITLYPYLPSEDRFVQAVYSGDLRKTEFLQPTVLADNIAWLTLKLGKPVWAKDSTKLYAMLGGDPAKREGDFEAREEIRSTAALGLQIGNEAVGVMFANFRVKQRFPASQKQLILGLANYAAIGIKNYRKYTALNQRRYDDLVVLQMIDRQMRLTPGLKEIMSPILEGAVSRITAADESAIVLYNHRTEQLETAASTGSRSKAYENLNLPVHNGKGLTVWVYKNRLPVRVGNVKTDLEWRDIYYPVISDTLSEMDVPLIDEDQVVGVISFESKKENAFTKEDQEFIETLAGQAVLAIKNAQLHEHAELARKELETLHDVAQEITIQEGDPDRVMQLILKKARVLLGAEMGALQLYDGIRPGNVYLSEEDTSEGEPIIKMWKPGDSEEPVKLGIVQRVAETRRSHITDEDAAKDPHYEGSPDYHSEITVPVMSREDDLIGVLDLESPRFYAFTPNDLKVLEAFARQAGIAIEYAQVYSRAVSESERFRLLSEAGSDLAELTDINQIPQAYRVVLKKVSEFNDGEILVRRFDETSQALVLEDVLNQRPTPPPQSIPTSKGINGQVAHDRETIVVHDLRNIPEGIAEPVYDDASVRTLAVTPIQFQATRYYGNLVLSHEKPHSLSRSDISLLEGVAQQLAITIHRLEMVQARREAEQQAKDLELVSELGQSGMEIAHRLGTELATVGLYVNNIRSAVLRSGIESSTINRDLDRVIKDVGNVLNMSKGLMQKVSEIGGESFTQHRITLPIKALLEDSSWTLPLPENIQMRWELPEDLAHVTVVPGQIVDIMRNLVDNAIQAMPGGGRINIRAVNAAACVRIEVEDNGPGIPLKDQGKIFNLFFSTKQSSGFGLWSARRYARANKGELSLKSEPDRGATFILELPIWDRLDVTSEPPHLESENTDR